MTKRIRYFYLVHGQVVETQVLGSGPLSMKTTKAAMPWSEWLSRVDELEVPSHIVFGMVDQYSSLFN